MSTWFAIDAKANYNNDFAGDDNNDYPENNYKADNNDANKTTNKAAYELYYLRSPTGNQQQPIRLICNTWQNWLFILRILNDFYLKNNFIEFI